MFVIPFNRDGAKTHEDINAHQKVVGLNYKTRV
jgi:hypothetical protein